MHWDTGRFTSLTISPYIFRFMIRHCLERLQLSNAVINIPVNATTVPQLSRPQPPWSVWWRVLPNHTSTHTHTILTCREAVVIRIDCSLWMMEEWGAEFYGQETHIFLHKWNPLVSWLGQILLQMNRLHGHMGTLIARRGVVLCWILETKQE